MRGAAPLLLLAALGCGVRPAPEPLRPIRTCALQGRVLAEIYAEVDPRTGDTVVAGYYPFGRVFPRTRAYGERHDWFTSHEPIRLYGHVYLKYGSERPLRPDSIRPLTEYRGVPVFADTGALTPSHLLYVPVRPGCVFQPYIQQLGPAPVREP